MTGTEADEAGSNVVVIGGATHSIAASPPMSSSLRMAEYKRERDREVITLAEAARMIGVDHETARRWAVVGVLPAFQYVSRGRWRTYRGDIDDWVKSRKNTPATGQVEGAQN